MKPNYDYATNGYSFICPKCDCRHGEPDARTDREVQILLCDRCGRKPASYKHGTKTAFSKTAVVNGRLFKLQK